MKLRSLSQTKLKDGRVLHTLKEPKDGAAVIIFVHGMGARNWKQYRELLEGVADVDNVRDDMGIAALEWGAPILCAADIQAVQEHFKKSIIHLLTHSFGSTIMQSIDLVSRVDKEDIMEHLGDVILLTPAGLVQPEHLTSAVAREVCGVLGHLLRNDVEGSRFDMLQQSTVGAWEYVRSSGMPGARILFSQLANGSISIADQVKFMRNAGREVGLVGAGGDTIFPAEELCKVSGDIGATFHNVPGPHVCPVTHPRTVVKAITPALTNMHR